MGIDREAWAKRILDIQDKTIEYNKAEKVLIAFENPTIAIKWAVLYREVERLDGFYFKTYTDSEGYDIGMLRNLIFDDQETFVSECRRFIESGWVFEQGAYLNDRPVVESLLKREKIID